MYVHRNTCMQMSIAALFIITTNCKQTNCSSTREWINCSETLLSDKKEWTTDILNSVDEFQKHCTGLKKPGTMVCRIPFLWNSGKGKIVIKMAAQKWRLVEYRRAWGNVLGWCKCSVFWLWQYLHVSQNSLMHCIVCKLYLTKLIKNVPNYLGKLDMSATLPNEEVLCITLVNSPTLMLSLERSVMKTEHQLI